MLLGLGLKSLSLNMMATFGRQVGVGLLSLVTAALIARVYGPEGNGVFAIALLLPNLLSTLLNLGIGPANVYYIGSGQVPVKEAVKSSVHVSIWLTIVGLLIGGAAISFGREDLFPGVRVMLLWLALPVYPVAMLTGFLTSVFQGQQDFRTYNKILVIQPITLLFAVSIIALTGFKSLEILICVQLLSNFSVLAVVLVYIKRLYGISDNKSTSTQNYTKKAINYGWKANIGSVLSFLNYRADLFLLNFFLSPAATGIYVVAVTLVEKLWVISSAVSTVLLPRLAQLTSDEETRKRLTPLISRLVFFVTFLSSLALASLSYPIILAMFGLDYIDSFVPLLILLPGVVILGAAKVWANDIAARGKPEINMYVSLITLVINVVGNIILIPHLGIAGASIATTISYSACSAITLFIYVRLTSNNWHDTLLVNIEDIRSLKTVFAR